MRMILIDLIVIPYMQSTSLTPSKNNSPLQSQVRVVPSTALFGDRDEVLIVHGGETYRLRRTRQGKLILTK